MGPDGGAWKNPASLRTCGSGFKHRRRDFCRAYRIGISGFWIPLCSLLCLCDFKGSVFKKSAVALPASMDGGKRRMGRKGSGTMAFSFCSSGDADGTLWRDSL